MTRAELLTFVNTNLLDGRSMDETLFGIYLNLFKDKVEAARPWAKLRNEDSSQSITTSSVYTTSYTLPTRFAHPYPVKRSDGVYTPLVLVNGREVVTLEEIQWAQRLEHQTDFGYFAIDYANGTYCLTGTPGKSYTAYWSFIKYSPYLDADADQWVFPSQYHALLGYGVAAMEKARDYDEVNMANIALYVPEAGAIISAMNMWDTNIQKSMHGV